MNFDFYSEQFACTASVPAYIEIEVKDVMLSLKVSDDETREKVAEQGLIKAVRNDGICKIFFQNVGDISWFFACPQ